MHHILYAVQGCPYAIRSRLAIHYSGIRTELRVIDLNSMPDSLLEITPQASVPLLVLADGNYLDESWDIVKWALEQNDPDNWLGEGDHYLNEAEMLVEMNDFSFKQDLDHYQSANRYPEHPANYYREQAEEFIQELEQRLTSTAYLLANTLTIADIGVFPFVLQFARIEPDWFETAPYPEVRRWLALFLDSGRYECELYSAALKQYPVWRSGDRPVFLNKY